MSAKFNIPKNQFDGMINIHCLNNQRYVGYHTHDFLELVYVCSGSAEYHIGNTSGKLDSGDFFVVDYGTTHEYMSPHSDLSIINCLFIPEAIDETFVNIENFNLLCERYFLRITGRKINGPTSNQVFKDNGTVGEMLVKMLNEYSDKKDGYLEVMRCILREIIIESVRKVGSRKDMSALTLYITEEVEKHFNEPLSLSKLCQDKHFSLSYASARFRSDMNCTFTEYLQNRRIEEACRLLRETDLTVTEISEYAGYGNIKFFNRIFKNAVRTTPREFRKSVKK